MQILGEQVVLFRDREGRVHCLGDVCPHRGAPLHRGWVSEAEGQDCIVCPYHGWVRRLPDSKQAAARKQPSCRLSI